MVTLTAARSGPNASLLRGYRVGRAVFALGSLLIAPALMADESLRVGVYHNPPKLFLNDQQHLDGILGDLLLAIAEREAWQVEPVACEWQRCLALLERGDIDLLPDVAWSEARAERFRFHSEPALHSWSQIYQREGLSIEAVVDLAEQRVTVVDGSIQQDHLLALTQRFDIPVDWINVPDFEEGFTKVANGEADAAAANRQFGEWRASEVGLVDTPLMFQPVQLYFAASPSLPQTVLERLDDYLTRWKADTGSPYFATLQAWQAGAPTPPETPKWLRWGVAALIVSLVVALLVNLVLKRRVARQRVRLATNEAMLGTILDSVDAYIYIKSPDLTYQYVNHRICELFGRPAEAVIGQRDEVFFDPATAAEIVQVDRRVLASGEKITLEESHVLKHDDRVRTFLSIKMPLTLTPGSPPSLCGISTELTEYLEMQSRTHYLAYYDALTGLPNRRLLMESLATTIEEDGQNKPFGALMVVDLDHFRLVNDLQGHASGDQLLISVAEQLRQALDKDAMLARFSSDEFVVLVNQLDPQQEEAAAKAERIARQLMTTIHRLRNSRSLPISASLGLALFNGESGSLDAVLQQADMALQQAKASGGNTLRFFNPDMQASVLERANLEADLHHALARHELELHYQIQVNHKGVTTGVEALLRWYHPARGWVSPAEFIPLAEESGLIIPIGDWVLTQACQQLARWSRQTAYAPLTLSVNVSSVQFQQPDFINLVEKRLEQTQAPANRLVLEVTESLLMREPTRVRNTMLRLREQGVRFALDDFGTGYSSMSYLKRLPLDELKIDQSFIRELLTDKADAAIVDTIILLAVSLGLLVVAEGVETQAQLDWLKGHGCYRYQGYLLGHPKPIDDLFTDKMPRR
ncbi:PAS domain S-box-containing protein/diguanylate cyclase (GGDEF) domain-containing protein [Vreelandella subterranea]|uniref:cyclic-guanylate-specific phosphodiesterase n=1 Tax=Vreelandella subterranea TaxID=416874 RepID=A0A1H9TJ74_9GAMM|nr:EAL domain-containing protein [Halomonas subterranea]SER97275.1 PAS domain S-box-containing protein/diguanylate cyclase (GGDEF) domain-containing protein [Halomonas subterranea]